MIFHVGKTMPFLPPMTGNDNHTTYRNRDDWGMGYYCFTHISVGNIYPTEVDTCCFGHVLDCSCLQRQRRASFLYAPLPMALVFIYFRCLDFSI